MSPWGHPQTLRRCYSRVKEHGIGKRKSSYSIEQLEKVFGQGGWDSQGGCAPVLINSSGLYQEMESDSSALEDFSQEDWCNQVLASAFQEGDMEAGERVGMGFGRKWCLEPYPNTPPLPLDLSPYPRFCAFPRRGRVSQYLREQGGVLFFP